MRGGVDAGGTAGTRRAWEARALVRGYAVAEAGIEKRAVTRISGLHSPLEAAASLRRILIVAMPAGNPIRMRLYAGVA